MDLDRNLVALANEHWGGARLWSDPLDTVVERGRASFDAVISTQVFEHLTDPLSTLRTLRALLVPHGIALIEVPNLECAEERRHSGGSLDPTAHLYYFTRATLTRLMREAGFSVLACRGTPNNYSLYRRLFERIAGPALPVVLSGLTERLPLPAIGKGVFAVGRLPVRAA
jgi:2-polyprenyl-3-methyl-5-hydroxy-6-metoxy-1,4-benzoquinol methylase